jgi:hypothetical protein
MTFNIVHKVCPGFSTYNYNNIDIICTQEDDDSNDNIGEYILRIKHGTGGEIVGVYTKPDNKINIINRNKISSEPLLQDITGPTAPPQLDGAVRRNAILFSYKGIKIANLHLEGGINVDKYLLTNFELYLNYKLELLNKILYECPDIILGAFNSVYSTNPEILNKYLNTQYRMFAHKYKRVLTQSEKNNINKWNNEVFNLLKTNGYTYAEPENHGREFTSSQSNSIMDCIWYNSNKIHLIESNIIPLLNMIPLKNLISIFNPVYAKFVKKTIDNLIIPPILYASGGSYNKYKYKKYLKKIELLS